MLELEVIPERSLGNDQWELVLGMAFSQVVHILQQQFQCVRGIQVLYSELNPLAMDLVINLTQDGIKLIFDPLSQRLKVIEVYCMSKVKLKYCGNVFCSPEVPPTLEQIDHSFGATHPGEYHSSQQVFVLNFRGLTFAFAIDSKFQPRYARGLGSLQFGSFPVVSKMSIYNGNSLAETRNSGDFTLLYSMEISLMGSNNSASQKRPPPLPNNSFCNHCYLEKLDVIRENEETVGVKLNIVTEGFGPNKLIELRKQVMTKVIKFGDTAQDVSSALGSPNKVFYKSEDKMKIHSPNSHRYRKWSCSDYFYNYFTLGLDILFDAKSHRVKKFILHTNYPGHYNFNIYFRCNFNLPIKTQKTSAPDSAPLINVSEPGNHLITAFTKWDSMEEHFVKPIERPVVLNRASTHNATNPFGSTCCYGYQDIIFEVMPNNHLASVTLYEKKKQAKKLVVLP